MNDGNDSPEASPPSPSPAAEHPSSPSPSAAAPANSLAIKTTQAQHIASLHAQLYDLILLTIAASYYLDCLFLLLVIRYVAVTQASHGGGAGIRVVLTATVICIFTHISGRVTRPAAYTQWNNGGVLVDFVGELPASKLKMVGMDLWLCALQFLYLALIGKKAGLTEGKGTVGQQSESSAESAQDIEAEEAGVSRAEQSRHESAALETAEGIEMQSLLPGGAERADTTLEARRNTDDSIVILRKRDFTEVFKSTGPAAQSDESATAVRQFLARVESARARRADRANALATSMPGGLP